MYILFAILVILFSVIFGYIKYVFSYWDRNNFPFLKPIIPYGNLELVVKQKCAIGLNIHELYKQTTKPFIGIYLLFKPALLIRDPDLVKQILLTDFQKFYDRGIYTNPERDPLSDHMFAMPGKRWKKLRAKLSPTFTSGKLKSMFTIMMAEGENLQRYLEPLAKKGSVVEMKDLLNRYTLDIIGSVAFGIEVNSIYNPTHSFRAIEKRINSPELINIFRVAGVFLCPGLLKALRITSLSKDVHEFFIDIVKQTIELRESTNIVRKDFMQLLLQLRNGYDISEFGDEDNEWRSINGPNHNKSSLKKMTIEQCAAQAFLFYAAGFDTSASTVSYCIYEISRNREYLKKLQDDIDETLAKHNEELTYDCILDMNYLDLCVKETIRKYPALPILNRECTEDYQIPNTNCTVKKGTAVIISLLGFARDPNLFPMPDKYMPERFLDENFCINAFIPFGDGPRACIGFRMGTLMAKIGIVSLVRKYDFEVVKDAEIEFGTAGIVLVPKIGVNILVTERKNI